VRAGRQCQELRRRPFPKFIEWARALKVDSVRERLTGLGYVITGGTPEAYAKRLAAETGRWRKVIKAANIPAPT
jgi:tripartite-type tricarboxylate transporter receptor subunit TctC